MRRPGVSVIVPFAGRASEAQQLLNALRELRTGPGDEVIIADNSVDGVVAGLIAQSEIMVVRATGLRSSYHARNVGASAASRDWLLFTDSDCRPNPELLDEYFRSQPDEGCGALAGEIVGDPTQTALLARWARDRQRLRQEFSVDHPYLPYGSTANLLVRRTAFEQVFGFVEGVRSGGDVDFCWRVQRAGFSLEYRERAEVTHRNRESFSALIRQSMRYGASREWLERRYPGLARRQRLRPLLGALGHGARALLTGKFAEARFYGLDVLDALVHELGALGSNQARPWPLSPPPAS